MSPDDLRSILGAVFDSSHDLIAVQNRDLRVIYSNHRYLVGEKVRPHCHETPEETHDPCDSCPVSRVFQTGEPCHVTLHEPSDGFARDVSSVPIFDDSGSVAMVVSNIRDVSSMREKSRHIAHLNAILRCIRKVTKLARESKGQRQLLEDACGVIFETMEYDSIWTGMLDPESGVVELVARRDLVAKSSADTIDLNQVPCLRVLMDSDRKVLLNDDFSCGDCPAFESHGGRRIIIGRIGGGDSVYGGVVAAPPAGLRMDEDALTLFGELLDEMAFSIARIKDREGKRLAEKALRDSEADYSDLFSKMLSGFAVHEIILDDDGKPRDYRFLAVNPAFERITGLKTEEVLGRTVLELLPETEKYWIEIYGRVALTGEPIQFENYSSALKRHFEVSAYSPAPGRFACVFMDITERKEAEREIEALSRFPSENPNPVLRVDSGGVVIHANAAAAAMLDMMGCGDGMRLPHDWRGFAVRALESNSPAEHRLLVGDGDYSCWFSPVSENAYVNIYARDMTDYLVLEERLRQSQKMEAVGQLAGGVAHDFNNLLTVINGYSEMALEQADADSPLRPHLEQVLKAGGSAANLVAQLLLFSRRQVMRQENLDINDIISDLLKMLRRIIGEYVQIDFIPGRKLGIVRADRGMVEQILMNLCVNARDAMPDGGGLIIETETVLFDNDYCAIHPETKPGRYVMLRVTDEGVGMTPELSNRIFEPFFTTKSKTGGTGMGLATVYGAVRQHDGIINVYSEPGRGSTFKVYLPVTEMLASSIGPAIDGAPPVGHGEMILLAEDDDDVRELVAEWLVEAGYRVLVAADGEEAVEIFKRNAGRIGLLLFDVVMPKLGGWGAFEHICEIQNGVPVLFASGYSENAVHTNFVLKKGVDLIGKPFVRKDLLRKISAELGG